MDWLQRQTRLLKEAESDQIYQVWRQDFLSAQKAFQDYAERQAPEVQQILWKYADGGRLMQQRLVNVACMQMIFPEEM